MYNRSCDVAKSYLARSGVPYENQPGVKGGIAVLKIGAAGSALLGCHRIGCNQTKGSPGTLITPDHVGTTIGARKGYRRFDVKEIA